MPCSATQLGIGLGIALALGCSALTGCHSQVVPSEDVQQKEADQTPHIARSQDAAVQTAPATFVPSLQSLSGTWDWLLRSHSQQGDLRIEQEEWHLQQQGAKLHGDYLRQVTMLSRDQKPYRCNGQLGFVVTSRVRVEGQRSGDQVELRELSIDQEQSPCADAVPALRSYQGMLQGDRLILRFAGGVEQLVLRASLQATGLRVSPLPPIEGNGREPMTEAERNLAGVWDWQTEAKVSTDGEGDLHSEKEEWHLVDLDGKLAGYFDRVVERRRLHGVFPCSGSQVMRTQTRYTLRGRRTGDQLFFNEVDYKSEPSPCENGGRRLDSYRGTVLSVGLLLLEWSGGQQLLRRRTTERSP